MARRASQSLRLVIIDWMDSFGCSPNWQPLEVSAPKPMRVRSVGWLLYDGKDCKVIVPHVSDDRDSAATPQGCGDMTIPSRSITKIRTLR